MASTTPPANGTPPIPPENVNPFILGPLAPLDIQTELAQSYLTYAMSVIVSRALPDVRDGLKPSQRRILVAMNDLGLGPSTSTSKCAAIVGETMKRYHPHGDSSIYGSLVRMAQDWVLRYRLIHGQGNFGSVAGLPAAAHRYTEARLTSLAAEMLDDLDKDTVDFIDNYDGKYREPLVLPARVPNLLINGCDGIAVGMATEIPPHNLGEVCNAMIALTQNENLSLGEILRIMPGPDFPTGGIIRGRNGIIEGYRSGRGKITLRARVAIREAVKGQSAQLVIQEVPFQVTRNKLAEDIGKLVRDERIKDISAMRDESSARNGEPVRLVIDLKRGADPHLVLNQLYEFSPLQKTVSLILLALVDGRPRVLTVRDIMLEFLKHRRQVIRRRTEFQLREAKRRGHVLEGQLIAMSSIDEVIEICRTSPSRSEAKLRLQGMEVSAAALERAIGAASFAALQHEIGVLATYSMTEQQSESVVRMQLGQLANLERDEIFKEYLHLRDQIDAWELLISDEENINVVIREDLERIRDRFSDVRRTEISDEGGSVDYEDLIPETDQIVNISHNGYIKRMPTETYRAQNRGGKGVHGGAKDDDFIEHFFVASSHAYLLCFTSLGQLYWLKVYNIPEASRTSAGRSIANVLALKADEKITSIIPIRHFEAEASLLMATRRGLVKKTVLTAYSRPRQGGLIGIALEDGDSLIRVCVVRSSDEVILSTRNGMAIRFDESDVRQTGRDTYGVRGVNLGAGDELVGMVVTQEDGQLLSVCEKGYGKRTPIGANTQGEPEEEPIVEGTEPAADSGILKLPEVGEEEVASDPSGMRYRKQRRGGKGVRDIKTSDRNGKVVAIQIVKGHEDVMLISRQGQITRIHASDIRMVGRNTQGVRVMTVDGGDTISSVALMAREEVPEIEAIASPPDGAFADAAIEPIAETVVDDVPF